MLVALNNIGEVHYRSRGTNGYHLKADLFQIRKLSEHDVEGTESVIRKWDFVFLCSNDSVPDCSKDD